INKLAEDAHEDLQLTLAITKEIKESKDTSTETLEEINKKLPELFNELKKIRDAIHYKQDEKAYTVEIVAYEIGDKAIAVGQIPKDKNQADVALYFLQGLRGMQQKTEIKKQEDTKVEVKPNTTVVMQKVKDEAILFLPDKAAYEAASALAKDIIAAKGDQKKIQTILQDSPIHNHDSQKQEATTKSETSSDDDSVDGDLSLGKSPR
ncbi:MAG: hypothetical protein ACK4PR_08505, partial [Gammaproteobacteria bacterium]